MRVQPADFCALSAPGSPPNAEAFHDATLDPAGGDSAHAHVKSAIREVNCARLNLKATPQTSQTRFLPECAAPARRWEERTTSFES